MKADTMHQSLPGENAPQQVAQLWAVGGGKGGSGKSFLTSLMGILLAESGRKVILMDSDFGGANLHSFLGVKKPGYSLTDFFDRKVPLQEIVLPTWTPNLRLVIGDVHAMTPLSFVHTQKLELFHHIRRLDAELILIDLGAGSAAETVDTFLIADKLITMTTPQTISFDNLYHFLNKVLFRKLNAAIYEQGLQKTAAKAWKSREGGRIRTIRDFINHLSLFSPKIKPVIDKAFADFHIHVVMNYVRSKEQAQTGESLGKILHDYYGIGADFSGFIHYYEDLWQYNNRFYPLLKAQPHRALFAEVRAILAHLTADRPMEAEEEVETPQAEPAPPVITDVSKEPEPQPRIEAVTEVTFTPESRTAPPETVPEPEESDTYEPALISVEAPPIIHIYADTAQAIRAMNGKPNSKVKSLPFKVGRTSNRRFGNILKKNDLYLYEDPPYTISRNHFAITEHAGQLYFHDQGSKLGSVVNRVHVGGEDYNVDEVPLRRGENSISIGPPSKGLAFTILIK